MQSIHHAHTVIYSLIRLLSRDFSNGKSRPRPTRKTFFLAIRSRYCIRYTLQYFCAVSFAFSVIRRELAENHVLTVVAFPGQILRHGDFPDCADSISAICWRVRLFLQTIQSSFSIRPANASLETNRRTFASGCKKSIAHSR